MAANFDREAEELRQKIGAEGIVLVVLGSPRGNGLSVLLSDDIIRLAPDLLECINNRLRRDVELLPPRGR